MSTEVDLGGFSTDVRQLVRHLKHDLKDDWFPDTLGFGDLLDPEAVKESISACMKNNSGNYKPEGRTELNIPKKGFTVRCSLETSLLDRIYYHGLVSFLAQFYDNLLPQRVLSHRLALEGRRSQRYLFKHPIEQWKLFEGYVRQESETKPFVLITDIENYYEHLTVDSIIAILRERIPRLGVTEQDEISIRAAIGNLGRCLPHW